MQAHKVNENRMCMCVCVTSVYLCVCVMFVCLCVCVMSVHFVCVCVLSRLCKTKEGEEKEIERKSMSESNRFQKIRNLNLEMLLTAERF